MDAKSNMELIALSALGQKQTYAVQQPMSALPSIATAKADMCQWSCPLYAQKQTCAVQLGMSAVGQSGLMHRSKQLSLFNYLVGALLEL